MAKKSLSSLFSPFINISYLRFAHACFLDVLGDTSKDRGWKGEVEEPVSSLLPGLKLADLAVQVLKGGLLRVGALHVRVDGPKFLHLICFIVLGLKGMIYSKKNQLEMQTEIIKMAQVDQDE
ncbi:MAG: hypothetical protein MJE68_21890 [Proteobacteria bacterium]|nr:hypothetical protein [Pseudomonadota bacterium]